jgi:hypothetical protein
MSRSRCHAESRPVHAVALLGCLAILFHSAQLEAQSVRGTLVEESSGIPIEGAFVVLLDGSDSTVAGTLTDDLGVFVLQAPAAGRYAVRAERIGYDSFSSLPLSLTLGPPLQYRLEMPVRPVELATLSVETERRCESRPEDGRRMARVWEEAKKALTTAVWTEQQRAFRFTTRLHRRTLDPRGLRVLQEETEILSGLAVNPFRALPAEELAASGYTRRLPSDTTEYFAPDAQVLLSDLFLDDHCFRVVEGGGETAGMIGLGFEPLLETDRTDISGVLWLDRSTAHLQFIQYRYENLPSGVESDELGGRVGFRRLPGGAWIVDDWHIRMPVLEEITVMERTGPAVPGNPPRARRRIRLGAIEEQGGEVLIVADAQGRITVAPGGLTPGRGALSGQVFDSTSNTPLGGATVSLLGTNLRTISDAEGRYSLEDLPVGEFYLTFSHRRADALRLGSVLQRAVVQEGEVARVDLAVPPASTVIPALCPASEGTSGGSTESVMSVIAGTVVETGSNLPVGDAIVHLSTHVLGVLAAPVDLETLSAWRVAGVAGPGSLSRFETVADQNGSFLLCGIPAGLRLYAGAIDPSAQRGRRSSVVYFTTPRGIHTANLQIAPQPEASEGS